MWFEILPAIAIITASVAAPHGLAYILNYLVLDNCYRRLLETDKQRIQYLRDRRLTHDPYKVSGLENIPKDPNEPDDPPEEVPKCKLKAAKSEEEVKEVVPPVVKEEAKGSEEEAKQDKCGADRERIKC